MSQITPQTRWVFGLFAFSQLLAIGWIDFATGYEISFVAVLFIPIAFCAWFIGLRSGLGVATLAAFMTTWSEAESGRHYSRGWVAGEHAVMNLVVFGFVAFSFGFFRNSMQRERERSRRMEGLVLTFCSCCSKVRDADDNWRELSSFLRESAPLDTRTKLCPDCARGVYARQSGVVGDRPA